MGSNPKYMWPTLVGKSVKLGDMVRLNHNGLECQGIITDFLCASAYVVLLEDFTSVLRVHEEMTYLWYTNHDPQRKELPI